MDDLIGDDIVIEDTTLRDGEQAPGVAFGRDVKRRIHDLLVALGGRWIEAGAPAMGGEEEAFRGRLVADGSKATRVAWRPASPPAPPPPTRARRPPRPGGTATRSPARRWGPRSAATGPALRVARLLGLGITGLDVVERGGDLLLFEANTSPGWCPVSRPEQEVVAERCIEHAVRCALRAASRAASP